MNEIPTAIREGVIKRLYTDAERLDWENLSVAEKTSQYAIWLEDEDVGGRLLRFRPSESEVRVWIKDGPMKEYSRALLGVGPCAGYVENPHCTPSSVVRATLGESWEAMPETIEIKPARCRASGPGGESIVLWGKTEDFKFLLFAALEIAVSEGAPEITVAIVETAANPTAKPNREQMGQIAARCNLGLRFVNPVRARRAATS